MIPVNLYDDTKTCLSEMLAAVSRIEGFDIESALGRIGWRQSVLEDSIKQTVFSAETNLSRMDDCLSAGDLQSFSILAHGFKGSLNSIGAVVYAELASELELTAKTDNPKLCREKFAFFSAETRKLFAELSSHIPGEEVLQRRLGDHDFLLRIAGEALDMLEQFEQDEALTYMKELDAFTYGEETDALLKQIKNAIQGYKVSEAALLLKCILQN